MDKKAFDRALAESLDVYRDTLAGGSGVEVKRDGARVFYVVKKPRAKPRAQINTRRLTTARD